MRMAASKYRVEEPEDRVAVAVPKPGPPPPDYILRGAFSQVNFACGCKVRFAVTPDGYDIVATEPIKVKVEKETLTIEGKGGAADCGSSFQCVTSGGMFSSCFGSGVSISNGSVSFNGRAAEDEEHVVYVNGKRGRVVLDDEDPLRPPKPKDLSFSTTWHVKGPREIEKITARGPGTCVFADVLVNRLTVAVTGSTTVKLPTRHFGTAIASVTGSGTVDFGGARIADALFSVTGSGDLINFRADQSLTATVTGSGDIRGTRSSQCTFDKRVTGSGDIKVKKD